MPSGMTIRSATSHPSIACGPPRAVMSRGIVMNGPTPIMFVMLSAVAWSKPNRRGNAASVFMDRRESNTRHGGARKYTDEADQNGHRQRHRRSERVFLTVCVVLCLSVAVVQCSSVARRVLVVQSGTSGGSLWVLDHHEEPC